MPKIILVSHSKEIASGTKSLLKQMAGDIYTNRGITRWFNWNFI